MYVNYFLQKFFQDKKKNIENLKAKYLQKSKFQQQLNPVTNEEEEKNKMTRKIISINELRERVLCDLDVLFRVSIFKVFLFTHDFIMIIS